MDLKPTNIVIGITATLSMIAGVIAFDSRYTKQDEFVTTIAEIKGEFVTVKEEFVTAIDDAKNDIIDEMRTEVVKNRSVMITTMQREADDLEFRMVELENDSKTVPRFMIEKHKQILRQIEALKENEITD